MADSSTKIIKKIIVSEIFTSIQGESTYAGQVCFFIRLAGCNLNCTYCDTEYSRDPKEGKEYGVAELVKEARNSRSELVEITGGEPLLQENVNELCQILLKENFTVLLETNGSLPISVLPVDVIRILDCKAPSTGCAEKMNFANFANLKNEDEVKFVIADENDYKYAVDIIHKYKIADQTQNILFSPAWGKMDFANLAEWIVRDNLPVRLQIQLHKIIWGPDKRGT